MEPVQDSLVLTPSWQEAALILVRVTDGLRLCRERGYREVPSAQATARVRMLDGRHMPAVRAFVSRVRLSTFPPSALTDHNLLALLEGGLRTRDLVVLQPGEGGDDDSPTAQSKEQRQVVRGIESRLRQPLSFAGRRFKLVADVDFGRLPDRDSYEVVRHDQATRVLTSIAAERGSEPELAKLLGRARGLLTKDWRPPLSPDGIILLRRAQVAQAFRSDAGPAMTPSQIKDLVTKTDWIEIEVVDQDGEPYLGRFHLELPDGATSDGSFDEEGFFGNYDIESGNCKLTLLDRKEVGVAAEEAPEQPDPPVAPAPVPVEDQPAVAYRVTLQDDFGNWLNDVEVNITVAGETTSLTSADGQVGLEGATRGGATIGFAAPKRIKAMLKENRKKGPAAESSEPAPTPAGQVQVLVADTVTPASIPVGEDAVVPLLLQLPPSSLSFVELEDVFFRTDSAVVLPDNGVPRPTTETTIPTSAAVLATTLRFAQDNPDNRLLVAGHTDSVGTKDYNQTLSEDRARAALACLRGDRAVFQDVCDQRHKVADIKQILAWADDEFGFGCNPGAIDDNANTAIEPIRRFQRGYNEQIDDIAPGAEPLAEDGSMGPKTWGAVFDCYEYHLARQLVDSPDADERRSHLGDIRGALQFVDPGTPSQGFGETQPIEAIGADGVRSQTNRRVELLFFEDDDLPSLDGPPESSEVYRKGRFTRIPVPVQPACKRGLGRVWVYGDDDTPLAGASYRLTVNGVVTCGKADGGFVLVDIPPGDSTCLVEWSPPSEPALTLGDGQARYQIKVALGSLDASSDQGAAAMLGNIGYDVDDLKANLLLFQGDSGLALSGELDADTQQALSKRHAFLAKGANSS